MSVDDQTFSNMLLFNCLVDLANASVRMRDSNWAWGQFPPNNEPIDGASCNQLLKKMIRCKGPIKSQYVRGGRSPFKVADSLSPVYRHLFMTLFGHI